ncbi:MAG: helix-turn-helix domain-containing protein [Arenicella sp.]
MSIEHISSEPVRRFYVGESFVELLPSSPYSALYTPEHSVLGFAFDGQSGIHSFGSDHRQDFQTLPNSFAFVPAGCDVFSESEHGGEYLKISLAPDNPLHIVQSEPLNQLILTKSRLLAQELRTHLLISSIENTNNGKNTLEPIFLENLLDQIKHELHLNDSSAEQSVRIKYTLHCRQLANIEDYIDANIDHSISVQTMAEVVNMSAGHFSRTFKASIGVSPFDYVIQRRLARARSCVHQSNLDLSHIAFAHGFSSHAHMSMVFKKYLGLTPSQLRKA